MKNLKILLAEPEGIVAMDLKTLLQSMGHTVVDTLSHGKNAMESVIVHKPDIAIIETSLPGTPDGTSRAMELRNRFNIPTIFLTTSSSSDFIKRSALSEPFGYVLKPVNERDLKMALDVALYKINMELKNKNREKWVASALGRVGEAVIVLDRDHRIVYMNVRAENMTGIFASEAMGQHVKDILTLNSTRDGMPLPEYMDKQSEEDQEEDVLEATMVGQDCQEMLVGTRISRVFDGDEEQTGTIILINDLTEKQRLKTVIDEKDKIYRALIESSNEQIFMLDLKGTYVASNDQVSHFGLDTGEDISGKKIEDVFPPEVAEQYRRMFSQVLDTKEPVSFEHPMPEEDRMGHHNDTLYPVIHEGKIIAVGGICRDITQYKEMEKSLENMDKKYRVIVENLNEGLWQIDEKEETVFVNKRMAEMLGYSPEEMMGRHLFDFMDKEGIELAKNNLERRRTGIREQHDFQFKHKDDRKVYATLETAPLFDGDDNYYGAIAGVQDITLRKKTEIELAQREAELAATFYGIGDAVISTNTEGKILRLNKVAEKLTGWTEKEALGIYLGEVFHIINEETREKTDFPMETVLKKGMTIGLANHTVLVSKDGVETPIADSAAPVFGPDKEVRGMVLVFRDQTKERLIQKFMDTRFQLIDYAVKHTLDELLTEALNIIGEYVDSPIGFYHFVGTDENTLILQQWSTRTLREFCTAEGKGMHYAIEKAGVWADCLRQRQPVVHNDYASLAEKKGLPEGHAPILRELVVPVISDEKVVAILGVGNKPRDYTEDDVQTVSYLANTIWEIVQIKKNEEKLRHERDVLENYIELSDTIFVSLDKNGDVVFINRNGAQILGCSPEEVIGKNWFDNFLPPENKQTTKTAFQRLMNGEKRNVEHYENPLKAKDGMVKTFLWHNTVIEDKDGNITGTKSSGQDITSRKKMEEALNENEERYRLLFTKMLDGFAQHEIIYDDTGNPVDYRFLEVNPAFESMTGLKAEDILGKTVLEVLPNTEKYWIETYGKLVLTGESITFENYSFELDKHFSVAAFQTTPHRFATIIEDITHRKEAEKALMESEKRFRDMADMLPIAVFEANQECTITYANQRAYELTGYTVEDIAEGVDCFSILIPEDRERAKKNFKSVLEGKDVGTSEYSIMRKNGALFPCILRSMAIENPEGTSGIRSVIVDVTEIREYEEQLRKTIREKEVLLNELQHRVKNNMQLVSSFVSLQSMRLKEEEAKMPLRSIQGLVMTLANLHSRAYQTGTMGEINIKMGAQEILGSLIKTLAPDEKKVDYHIEGDEIPLAFDTAVPVSLIINELALNSLKHAFDEQKHGNIKIHFSSSEDNICISYEDDGKGLPDGLEIEKVKTVGLKLIKNLVDQIDGEMEIEGDRGMACKIIFKTQKKDGGAGDEKNDR